jgi:hypothetical protein
MDVTRENFATLMPLIKESIAAAEFIGFDTEFSGKTCRFYGILGLNVGYDDRQHDYDTVEDRYQKLMHNCTRMNTFQIGIAAFIWNEADKTYKCRPFNFYVFKDSTVYDSSVLQF